MDGAGQWACSDALRQYVGFPHTRFRYARERSAGSSRCSTGPSVCALVSSFKLPSARSPGVGGGPLDNDGQGREGGSAAGEGRGRPKGEDGPVDARSGSVRVQVCAPFCALRACRTCMSSCAGHQHEVCLLRGAKALVSMIPLAGDRNPGFVAE